jgi:uncharacterized protein YdeI (YjbR/CyaY-like superfamily)
MQITKTKLHGGTVHKIPDDLRNTLVFSKIALTAWQNITPLARNEWLCWIESAKKDETRLKRIKRTVNELAEGKRRPCCWIGCIHRRDKALSPSVKYILDRKNK